MSFAAVIPRPHDALFKSAFEAPADAAALLRELLPAALRPLIAWDTLHGEPGSFVHPALADQHSDLLFSARLRTEDAAALTGSHAPQARLSRNTAAGRCGTGRRAMLRR
ncbi:MAG TPA: Rpn family recombination-promoting nuclease/putative transposase [Kofleriaceae bacterium]